MKRPAAGGLKRPARKEAALPITAAQTQAAEESQEASNTNEAEPEQEPAQATDERKKAAGKEAVNIVSTTKYPGGWICEEIKTPKGRVYPKWTDSEGNRFMSLTQAQKHGFQP